MFRLYGWRENQTFQPDPFDDSQTQPQDQGAMWFAGDHSDIGGGYPERRSQPAKFPLIWLSEEGEKRGLRIDQTMFQHLADGKPRPKGRHEYVAPDATAPIHDSMRGFWRILECLPKRLKWRRWPNRTHKRGWYLPRSEPRKIPKHEEIHVSVRERQKRVSSYRPGNLRQYD